MRFDVQAWTAGSVEAHGHACKSEQVANACCPCVGGECFHFRAQLACAYLVVCRGRARRDALGVSLQPFVFPTDLDLPQTQAVGSPV